MGARATGVWLLREGFGISFVNSLRASAIGWGIPIIMVLFGPLRS